MSANLRLTLTCMSPIRPKSDGGEIKRNMEYNKIIAVTGLPGLFELLSSKSDGAIVRSLEDKTTRFVSSRIHNFSHLESIEVYTVRDNVNLIEILKAMEDSKDKLPDDKDANALKAYFTRVYPDLDFTRVYSSDLKKMVKWFAVLKANDIEIKLSEPEEDGQEESEAEQGATVGGSEGGEAVERKAAGKGASGTKATAPEPKARPAAPEKKATAADQKATDKSAGKSEKAPAGKSEKTPAEKSEKAPAAKKASADEEKPGKKPVAGSSGKAGSAKAEKDKKTSAKKTDKAKKAAKKK